MTSTLALALQLGRLDDDDLRTVLAVRAFHPARVNDLFDLAEALLITESIQAALARLDRPTLALLAAAAAAQTDAATSPADTLARWGAPLSTLPPTQTSEARLAHLARLHLISTADGRISVYTAVRERLDAWPSEGLPSGPELAAAPPPPVRAAESPVSAHVTTPDPTPDADQQRIVQLAAEHAFSAVGATVALLIELSREPARRLQKGGLAHPDTRRLAAATGLNDDTVATLLWAADKAGLTAIDGASVLATHAAADWFTLGTRQRWAALADGWAAAMPADVRSVLTARSHDDWADGLLTFAHWLYPADPKRLARRLDTFGSVAELLGITVDRAPTRAGTVLLDDGADAASTVLAAHLPAEIDRVYLQHDLSIIAPGPLVPAIDTRLRTFADIESRALASTFRVSAASITRAIASGEDAAGLRTFLQQISLTGIPQPLDYLLTETAARYGLVRVAALHTGADAGGSGERSRVRSADTGLLDAIGIDQTLTTLGLKRTSKYQLDSRFERDVVFWALSDARYPVVAENADGQIAGLKRRAVAARVPRRGVDPLDALFTRLRASGPPDAESTMQAWLSRQLDAAVRARSTLIVTVAIPGGEDREYTLEPTGLGGGRLRGRDRATDVERTLPLSSIRGIRTP
ncbi:MAG: helicase-associated domain-containing protein [Microbacteriaceae bacterium]